jgi:hypothetical protein
MFRVKVMHDFWMKEMHFSQQITNIGTRRSLNNHRQRVYYRMADSICPSDAQGADVTPQWNRIQKVLPTRALFIRGQSHHDDFQFKNGFFYESVRAIVPMALN